MSVAATEARGAALIVAADREDRRVLFDALDAQAFEEIYSAKDIEQARSFLAPDLDIDVVLLEFDEQPDEALAFCEELRKNSRRELPVNPPDVAGRDGGEHEHERHSPLPVDQRPYEWDVVVGVDGRSVCSSVELRACVLVRP